MKKKIALVLSIVSLIFVLGACGTDPEDVDYNGKSYNELKTEAKGYVDSFQKEVASIEEYQQSYDVSLDEIFDMISSSSSTVPDYYFTGIEKWIDVEKNNGDYVSCDTSSFKVDKTGNTLTTSMTLQFKDRTATFQVVYTYYNMEISGVVLEPDYTLGEKMKKAGMNTLISMAIVFCVLILISLIISCFKIFPYLENKKKAKAQAVTTEKDKVVTQIEQREQQLTDDLELVAVISAAIAASTGSSTSDFVVRSINRR